MSSSRYCVHPIASDVRLTHAVLPSQSSSRHPSEDHESNVESTAMTTSDWSPNVTSLETTSDYVNHNCASHTVAAVQALRKCRFYSSRTCLSIEKSSTIDGIFPAREEKAWKPCWLTLCDDPNGGCELIISDTEVVRF